MFANLTDPYDYDNNVDQKIDHKTGYAAHPGYDDRYYQELLERQDEVTGALAIMVTDNINGSRFKAA